VREKGNATSYCKRGDLIAQFLGCNVAVVLQKRDYGYAKVGRPLVTKSIEEEAGLEPWSRRYLYSILDFHESCKWEGDQEVYLYLDIATLQLITAC
jgi:hypothetical protein